MEVPDRTERLFRGRMREYDRVLSPLSASLTILGFLLCMEKLRLRDVFSKVRKREKKSVVDSSETRGFSRCPVREMGSTREANGVCRRERERESAIVQGSREYNAWRCTAASTTATNVERMASRALCVYTRRPVNNLKPAGTSDGIDAICVYARDNTYETMRSGFNTHRIIDQLRKRTSVRYGRRSPVRERMIDGDNRVRERRVLLLRSP